MNQSVSKTEKRSVIFHAHPITVFLEEVYGPSPTAVRLAVRNLGADEVICTAHRIDAVDAEGQAVELPLTTGSWVLATSHEAIIFDMELFHKAIQDSEGDAAWRPRAVITQAKAFLEFAFVSSRGWKVLRARIGDLARLHPASDGNHGRGTFTIGEIKEADRRSGDPHFSV